MDVSNHNFFDRIGEMERPAMLAKLLMFQPDLQGF
jgi:hypothetical protein